MKTLCLALFAGLLLPSSTLALANSGGEGPSTTPTTPAWKTLIANDHVTLKHGGRILFDATFMSGDNPPYDTDDGVEFRAARMFVSGSIEETVDFKADFDFAGGDVDFKDVWLGRKNVIGDADVKVGHFKEPMSLEEQTSGRFLTFAERSLMNGLVPGRNSGIMLYDNNDQYGWAVGVFRDTDDDGDDNTGDEPDSEGDGEYAITGRFHTNLMPEEDDGTLHLGISYSLRSADDGMASFSVRPEAHLTNAIVSSGAIAADGVDLGGLEGAWVQGPLAIQAEYFMASIDGSASADDADFSGGHVEASYFLTGESFNYKNSGKFDRVSPNSSCNDGGCGAWLVALRYSMLDLDDGPSSGEVSNIGLGATWILSPHTRMVFNVIRSEEDASDSDATIGIVRFQADW